MIKYLLAACVTGFVLTSHAQAASVRVASANLCADQLLIEMAQPEQIAAVSHFATDPLLSVEYESAKSLPSIRGTVEEMVRLKPDVALVGRTQIPKSMQPVLAPTRIVEIGIPTTITEVENQIRQMGELLDRPEIAKRLIARMQARLIQTRLRSRALTFVPRVLVYHHHGYTESSDSILASLLPYVGAQLYTTDAHVTLEQLVADPPDLIIYAYTRDASPALGNIPLSHPVFREWKPTAFMAISPALLMCNNHHIADIASQIMDHLEMLEPPTPKFAMLP